MKHLFLVLSLLLLSAPVQADDLQPIEKIARAYAKKQPALENYQVTVETEKVEEMLEKMTANIPADAPRPPSPLIRKYWQRSTGKSLIRAEGPNIFPYMQEMVKRFSGDFALELYDFLLPVGRSADRAGLVVDATVKTAVNDLAGAKLQTTSIQFPAAVDLAGAFYGEGLSLPQAGVIRLVFDVDPELEVVKRVEVTLAAGGVLSLEIRYRAVTAGLLPENILVTSLDGRIDNRYETKFSLYDGVWLPRKQKRFVREGDKTDMLKVTFVDYEINAKFPKDVRKLLAP